MSGRLRPEISIQLFEVEKINYATLQRFCGVAMTMPNRLHTQIAEMFATEGALAALLGPLSRSSNNHRAICQMLQELQTTSQSHLEALQSRMADLGCQTSTAAMEFQSPHNTKSSYPVTDALSVACASLNKAIIGYAILRSVALRFRDSSLIGPKNTGDLAEQHTKNYVTAVHRINQALHNVVLWELDNDGATSQCSCPSCGLGICMCAQGPRRTLSDIWSDAGPISTDSNVHVHQPRSDSAAAKVGLVAGDEILRADGQELETHFVFQGIISGHAVGEPIELRVKRASGEIEDISIIRD